MKLSYLNILIEAKDRTVKKYKKKASKDGSNIKLDNIDDQYYYFTNLIQENEQQDKQEFLDG